MKISFTLSLLSFHFYLFAQPFYTENFIDSLAVVSNWNALPAITYPATNLSVPNSSSSTAYGVGFPTNSGGRNFNMSLCGAASSSIVFTSPAINAIGKSNVKLGIGCRKTASFAQNVLFEFTVDNGINWNTIDLAIQSGLVALIWTYKTYSLPSLANNSMIKLRLSYTNPSMLSSTCTPTNGNFRIDDLILGQDKLLPVELLYFKANKNNENNILEWQTASEKNNALFNIERSADGESFFKIGETKGKGNSTVEQKYFFTDPTPLRGISYYRLKQEDFDGTAMFSKIVSIDNSGKGQNKVKVYPSITNDEINIELSEATKADISIRDLTGRTMLSKNTEGVANQTLDLGLLLNGLYILSVRMNDTIETFKIQKY
jgi:Secretion system C-terminal sorting domain